MILTDFVLVCEGGNETTECARVHVCLCVYVLTSEQTPVQLGTSGGSGTVSASLHSNRISGFMADLENNEC